MTATQIVELMDQVGWLRSQFHTWLLSPGWQLQIMQISGTERPLRQGPRRHLKYPNSVLEFDQLFWDVILDPANRENMTSWTITDKEKVGPWGNAWSRNIKWWWPVGCKGPLTTSSPTSSFSTIKRKEKNEGCKREVTCQIHPANEWKNQKENPAPNPWPRSLYCSTLVM